MILTSIEPNEVIGTIKTIAPIILAGVLIIIGGVIGNKIMKSIRRVTRSVKSTIRDVSNIATTVRQVATAVEEVPEIKSVGGATNVFLPAIQRDFPDFHNSSAESDIRTFVSEYINIAYGKLKDFRMSSISSVVELKPNKVKEGAVTNITFNKIAIYDYKKTKEYATIKYRVSVGFDVDGKRTETRYEVSYTYQLEVDSIATAQVKCTICGAPIEDLSTGKCPYCGAAFIKDTIMSWDVTSIDNF